MSLLSKMVEVEGLSPTERLKNDDFVCLK